jgi:hypothetical protein
MVGARQEQTRVAKNNMLENATVRDSHAWGPSPRKSVCRRRSRGWVCPNALSHARDGIGICNLNCTHPHAPHHWHVIVCQLSRGAILGARGSSRSECVAYTPQCGWGGWGEGVTHPFSHGGPPSSKVSQRARTCKLSSRFHCFSQFFSRRSTFRNFWLALWQRKFAN